MAQKLDTKSVKALEPPATGNRIVYDADVKGFGVRITAAGGRSFVLNYRHGGRERRYTIGSYPDWSVIAARNEAASLKREIDRGRDPMAERENERLAPTVAGLAARYEAEHLPSKRQRSAYEDQSLLRGHILPALGRLKVADVTRDDVARMHRRITEGGAPVRANRALALVRAMLNLAVAWDMRTDNPARGGRGGIAMNPEDHRERFLSPAEIARLAAVLDRHPERTTVALIRFLMMTGCRFGEAAAATWDQFDLASGIWTKPSSHTKAKKQHKLPLSAPALALLSERKRETTGQLVFPSAQPGRKGSSKEHPLTTIKTAWWAIRRDAGLDGVRLHDLRHSFASMLASSGASLQLIGSLLGHAQIATTMRYAHLADDARRAAVERVGATITGIKQPGELVTLKGGRSA